jgi:RNA 2',3'-cyclic 3'-phosphodiesterase
VLIEGTNTVRAFFAIDLGERARAAAAKIADNLRACPDGDAVRWVRAETFHVTLRFLGDIDSDRIGHLAGCVRERTAALRPFRLQLGGARPFPSRRHPVALVLDVGPPEPLEKLTEAVERGVVAAGFDPESRPFHAHLTLGRVRGKHFPVVTGEVTTRSESFAVNEVVLFKSELQPSGAHYTPIEHAPLGGEPSPLMTETDQSIYNPKVGG